MPPKAKTSPSNGSAQSSATIGFEAKLWLTADSRSAAETAEGNRSNNMDAAEPSGARQTAAGSPQGERGGAHQYFLTGFASAEGKNGGQFYTPSYYSLREATAQLQQRTHGTVFDTITKETFKTLDCIFPTPKITAAFDKLVELLLGQIRANLHQSRTLATLRDTLLPKLLSGELSPTDPNS